MSFLAMMVANYNNAKYSDDEDNAHRQYIWSQIIIYGRPLLWCAAVLVKYCTAAKMCYFLQKW